VELIIKEFLPLEHKMSSDPILPTKEERVHPIFSEIFLLPLKARCCSVTQMIKHILVLGYELSKEHKTLE